MKIIKFEDAQLHLQEDKNHEFLLTNKEVALGYGITTQNIKVTKDRHQDELIEGKHWVKKVIQTNGGRQKVIHWTKRGIIRLGFFIKSQRARKFRDFIEDLTLKELDKRLSIYAISGYKSQISQKNKKIQKLLEYKDSLEQCKYFYLLQEKELKDLKKENEKLRKMLIDRLLITDKDKTESLRCISISEFSEMLDDIGYEFESRSASILKNAKKLLSDLARDTVINMHRKIAKTA